jgi:hypothetical protein
MLTIKLRAHHGLCIAFFEGKGYNDYFVENMRNVITTLNSNPNVTITFDEDIVCVACPNNKNGICDCIEKVNRYDETVLRLCNIRNNTILPWQTFKALVMKKVIKAGMLSTVCSDCQWANICIKKGTNTT